MSVSDFNSLVNKISMFQDATAEFIAQMTMCVTSLCEKFQSDHVLLPKPQLVAQQLQLQALTLEVNQLRGQLVCAVQENDLLKQRLCAAHSEIVTLSSENVMLVQQCSDKEESLNIQVERTSEGQSEIGSLRSQIVELECDRISFAAKLEDVQEHAKLLTADLENAAHDKANLELEIARLKHSVHLQLSNDVLPLCKEECDIVSNTEVVRFNHNSDDEAPYSSRSLENSAQGVCAKSSAEGGTLARVVTV